MSGEFCRQPEGQSQEGTEGADRTARMPVATIIQCLSKCFDLWNILVRDRVPARMSKLALKVPVHPPTDVFNARFTRRFCRSSL